jgi:spermidine synthase
MIPWERFDSTPLPGSRAELHLYKRGAEFSIRVESRELMNSRVYGSEARLAELACARLGDRPRPRVLIGGLGMGYTLAAALHHLGAEAQLIVAELVPAVVGWNRGPLASLAGQPLRDARVTVREIDVGEILKEERQRYDAIVLDVDNGPDDLTRESNDWLYTRAGLDAAGAALRPKGVLAVWAVGPDRPFTQRLRRAGFAVDEVRVRARGARGGRPYTIWIAERRA